MAVVYRPFPVEDQKLLVQQAIELEGKRHKPWVKLAGSCESRSRPNCTPLSNLIETLWGHLKRKQYASGFVREIGRLGGLRVGASAIAGHDCPTSFVVDLEDSQKHREKGSAFLP
jgi:hypothetical protein